MNRLTRISREAPPPTLSLAVCKEYLRIFDDSHNATILLMRDAAIRAIENYTRQTFVYSTNEQYFDTVTAEGLLLSVFPVLSIDSLTVAGVSISAELVATLSPAWQIAPTLLEPPTNSPTLFGSTDCTIRYTSGWIDWPEDLLLLVLEKLAESFENRRTSATNVTNQFSRAHSLALEAYCSHHDAIR
jgi:hypothetical protein